MLRVISLFSLLNDDFNFKNGRLYIIPYPLNGRFFYANGGSYILPIAFISEDLYF